MSKPANSSYGWIVVGAGALMTCIGFGTMMSLGVFLQPMSDCRPAGRMAVFRPRPR